MDVEVWIAGGHVAGRGAEQAYTAEQEGFDGISFGDTQCISPDPYVGLAAAAVKTSRIKLGVGVTNPATRHPSVTAAAIAAVQVESNGRAVLGIGRGDSAVRKLGMKTPTVAMFEDYLARLQGYLRGESVEAGGLDQLRWLATIKELPKVPVDVAATGPAMISIGARLAEQVTFNLGANAERLQQAVDLARQVSADAQRSVTLGAYLNVAPHHDRQIAHDLVKPVVAVYTRFQSMPGHPISELKPEDAKVVQAVGANYDTSRHAQSDAGHIKLLDEDYVERFAVAGEPEHCIEKLAGIARLGIQRLALVGPARDARPEDAREARRLLTEVVIPGVREAVR